MPYPDDFSSAAFDAAQGRDDAPDLTNDEANAVKLLDDAAALIEQAMAKIAAAQRMVRDPQDMLDEAHTNANEAADICRTFAGRIGEPA